MPDAVIVSAVRTPIVAARKVAPSQTPVERLASHIAIEAIARSGVLREGVDDIFLTESPYGEGDLAHPATVVAGLTQVSGSRSTGAAREVWRQPLWPMRSSAAAPQPRTRFRRGNDVCWGRSGCSGTH
jgi:hypothetical protein